MSREQPYEDIYKSVKGHHTATVCTFMHLADAIIQSEILPANVSSGNQTHDLVALQSVAKIAKSMHLWPAVRMSVLCLTQRQCHHCMSLMCS